MGQATRSLEQSLCKAASAIARAAAVVTLTVASLVVPVQAKGPADTTGTIALTALPQEAQNTERLVRAGGPFPHAKDGSVFGNRERLLPQRDRGHYREYTVATPGARDRGARRLVCGGQPPTRPEACYYTDDHYASFRLVVQ